MSAVCVLHNYCLSQQADVYAPPALLDREVNGVVIPGAWHDRDDMIPLQQMNEQNQSAALASIQNEYREYFTSRIGELAWQYEYQ